MSIRSGKTIKILQEYEKAKADGKKVLLVDKEQLEKELLGAETPFDKLYKKLKSGDEEKNGINIFLIDEAFRKCWKDNGKLFEENEQLRQQLKEKEEDEQLYANEIVELRKTNEEWLQFKDLGGDY